MREASMRYEVKPIGIVESPLKGLEAVDGTPIVDIKPILAEDVAVR